MSKRPSIIGGLSLSDPAVAPPAEPKPEVPAIAAPEPRKTPPGMMRTSLYLPRSVHRALREIAFAREVKIHDVIMEGIDAALQKHGQPSIAALKARETKR